MRARGCAALAIVLAILSTSCSSNEACTGASVQCETGCALLATDNANCGACGNACPAGQVCSAGACATTCAAPLSTCGEGAAAFCADTRSDPAHCGGCDAACPRGQLCTDGQCVPECTAPLATCGQGADAFCADTRSDPAHCGGCDTACRPGEVCDAGRCAVTCAAAGSARCGDRCVDLRTDDAHCGSCGTASDAGTSCRDGQCQPTCPQGQARCGDQCVTLSSDVANCGACGNACPASAVCVDATCQAPACAGSFGLPGEPDVFGARTYVVAAGDLDGDGELDLAYAPQPLDPFQHGTEVAVVRNLGGRRFSAPVVIPLGFMVRHVFVGDVDGDRVLDLVAVGEGQGALLRGRGDGTFGDPTSFSIPRSTVQTGAALGDLDGDGRADLVVGTFGALTVYLGTPFGFGAATAYPAVPTRGLYPQLVALGDVNGDGQLDVITGEAQGGRIGVYANAGGGVLTVPATSFALSGSLQDLAAGDLDGDGLADAVAVDTANGGTLEVLPADGGGGFLAATTYPVNWSGGLALGDQDGDGLLDVAVGDWSDDDRKVVLFHNAGAGLLVPAGAVYDPGAGALVWADVDGDLRPDLVVASGPGGGVHLLWNRRGTLEEPALQPAPATDGVRAPSDVTVADVDGDGRPDAVAVDFRRREVLVYRGGGDGRLALAQVIPAMDAGLVRVGDVNGDGRPDLVVCSSSSGAQVFLGTADGFVAGAYLPSPRPWFGSGELLVDVDGDGALDLVGGADSTALGGPAVWRGQGDGTFAPPVLLVASRSFPQALQLADVDGNGWPDLVSLEGDTLRVYRGLGGGRFAPAVESPLGTSFDVPELAVGDLDGDGKPDVAVSDEYSHTVGVMRGRGDGSFATLQVRHDLYGPVALRVARLAGPRRAAVVIRSEMGLGVAVYEVDAHGVLQAPRVWSALGATGLDVGDVDGDLRPDVVTGARGGLATLPVRCLP